MSEFDNLVAHLQDGPVSVLLTIATYPEDSESGLLEEQGEVIESFRRILEKEIPTASSFRVMWTNLAFLIPHETLAETRVRIEAALEANRRPGIEVRAIVADLGSEPMKILDASLHELSSRRNFRSSPLEKVERFIVVGRKERE